MKRKDFSQKFNNYSRVRSYQFFVVVIRTLYFYLKSIQINAQLKKYSRELHFCIPLTN